MALNTGSNTREKGISQRFRRRLALSTALASAALVGYGTRGAYAGACLLNVGTYECSGAAAAGDVTQTLSGAPLNVTTDPGFGIDTSLTGGDAFTLDGTGGLTFTDNNNSAITGVVDGIDADNAGGGVLSITTTGQVTGTNGYGINAYNDTNGAGLTISAAGVSGGDYGITAFNEGANALSVTATGQVTGTNSGGIRAYNSYTGTDLTILAVGVTGGDYGIEARNYGAGALSVTATGPVEGTGLTGILAFNNGYGTDLTVSAAAATGGNYGILASNYGTGALNVTATGQVTGTGGGSDGIRAYNDTYGTDLTIDVAGVSGGSDGIAAANYGTGALSITATGLVEGTNIDGINTSNSSYGTDLTIEVADVSGSRFGISAENEGSGALSVTATGLVEGTVAIGIYATNSANGTDLTVSAHEVSGGADGIYAYNQGTGALSVTATGQVTGTTAAGITAKNSSSGTDLTVSAAGVSGADYGITARNYGTGALNVTATGQVTGNIVAGIYAYNGYDGTNLTVSAAGVSGVTYGIEARNYGTGALEITASGPVMGDTYDGIRATNMGTSLTIVAAGVTGGEDGIDADNSAGSGVLSVTVSGAVEGGTGHGIRTATGLGGSTVIALNAGADVSATSGIAISNDAGDSDTTVNTGASVTGEIRLANGDDDLTFDGGNFSGVTVFDGGDDTSAADGFVDKLTFKNVTGAVAGASVINWENVVVDMNGTINFTDNALEAGRLDAVNGGEISMETGAAENFQLTGDLGLASGGSLVLEFFTPASFDTFDLTGIADFGIGGEIDFLFDAGFDPLDGLSLTFLTALDGIAGFDLLDFNFIGLDPLFTAFVGLGPQEDEMFLSFRRRDPNAVPEPGTLALFGIGLLGLFGFAHRRKRRCIAA